MGASGWVCVLSLSLLSASLTGVVSPRSAVRGRPDEGRATSVVKSVASPPDSSPEI